MRVDLALKYLCLVKSRSLVKTLCDKEAIIVNRRPAKASTTLHRNDRITLLLPRRTLSVTLIDVPQKQLSRADAPAYYRISSVDETRDLD